MDVTSAKEGESSASTSAMAMDPVTVDVDESSVSAPVESAVMTAASLTGVTSKVMVLAD